MHSRAGIIATSLIGLAALTGALASCSGTANAGAPGSNQSKELTFATPRGTDDPKEQAVMKDLATIVGEASGRPVKNIQPIDYLGVVEAVRNGFVDVAILTQFSAALAYKTGSVDPLLVWGASSEPASFCLARKGSGIQSAADLRGHQIAFVDPGSTTGYFMPKALFKKAGLTDGTDYKSTFAGSHDSAVLALANGSVDVACTARQLYPTFVEKGLIKESEISIIAKSDPIPVGISVVVRRPGRGRTQGPQGQAARPHGRQRRRRQDHGPEGRAHRRPGIQHLRAPDQDRRIHRRGPQGLAVSAAILSKATAPVAARPTATPPSAPAASPSNTANKPPSTRWTWTSTPVAPLGHSCSDKSTLILTERHGSVLEPVRRAGLDDAMIARLRERLVVPND